MIGDRWARIAPMTRFYDLDAANAAVPELDGIVAPARRAARRARPAARRGAGRRERRRATVPTTAVAERADRTELAGRRTAGRRPATDPAADAGPDRPDGGRRRPDRRDGPDPARHRARPGRLPGPRLRPAGLAVLAARRDRRSAGGTASTPGSRAAARWPSWDDRALGRRRARTGGRRRTGRCRRRSEPRRWRRAWRPTNAATSSRRTRSSSRPGWAPTTVPSGRSSRA